LFGHYLCSLCRIC